MLRLLDSAATLIREYQHLGVPSGGFFRKRYRSQMLQAPGSSQGQQYGDRVRYRDPISAKFVLEGDTIAEATARLIQLKFDIAQAAEITHVETGVTHQLFGGSSTILESSDAPLEWDADGQCIWFVELLLATREGTFVAAPPDNPSDAYGCDVPEPPIEPPPPEVDCLELTGRRTVTPPPGSLVKATAWSPDGELLALAVGGGDVYIYDTTMLTEQAVLTEPLSTVENIAWSADSQYLAVGCYNSPYFAWYHRSGTSFTHLGGPTGGGPAAPAHGAAWSPDGSLLVVTHNSSVGNGLRFFSLFEKSGSGAGATLTKISPGWTDLSGNGWGVQFTPDGAYLAIGAGGSNGLALYAVSGVSLNKSSSTLSQTAKKMDWSSDGNHILIADEGSSTFSIYRRIAGTLSKVLDFAQTDFVRNVAWKGSAHFATVSSAAPYITTYKFDGSSVEACPALSEPATATGYGAAFSSDGSLFAMGQQSSPYVYVYDVEGGTIPGEGGGAGDGGGENPPPDPDPPPSGGDIVTAAMSESAIQAVLNATLSGGIVKFDVSAGGYNGMHFTVPTGVYVLGWDSATGQAAKAQFNQQNSSTPTFASSADDIVIDNVEIYNFGAGNAILISNCDNAVVQNSIVRDGKWTGLLFFQCSNPRAVRVIGCRCDSSSLPDQGNEADGIKFLICTNILASECSTYGNSDDGIDCFRSSGGSLKKCHSFGNGKGVQGNGAGFKLSNNILAEDCVSMNNRGFAFDCQGVPNGQMANNVAIRHCNAIRGAGQNNLVTFAGSGHEVSDSDVFGFGNNFQGVSAASGNRSNDPAVPGRTGTLGNSNFLRGNDHSPSSSYLWTRAALVNGNWGMTDGGART
jgi:hypothetical protein